MGKQVTVAEVMARAEKMLPRLYKNEAETRAMLYTTIGNIYKSIGLYREATPLVENAVQQNIDLYGEKDEKARDAMSLLANLYRLRGNSNDKSLFDRHLKLALRIVDLEKQIVANEPRIVMAMQDLASCYRNHNQYEEATATLEECLEIAREKIGVDSKSTFVTLYLLGDIYRMSGDINNAVVILERAKALSDKALPLRDLDRASCMGALAIAYSQVDRVPLAIKLLKQTLRIESKMLGEMHPRRLRTLYALSKNQLQNDKFDQAKENIDRGISTIQRNGLRETLLNVSFIELSGDYFVKINELDKAVFTFEQLLDKHGNELSGNHPVIIRIESKLNDIAVRSKN